MVDATTGSDETKNCARTAAPALGSAMALSTHIGTATPRNTSGLLFAPPQRPSWVEAWATETSADIVVACLLGPDGKPILALPLEVIRSGGQKTARFVGGSHANGNFPILNSNAPPVPRAAVELLIDALRAERPDVDMLALERMPSGLEGIANPLALLMSRPSPNISLALDLAGGFDAVLERSPSRKGRRYRAQARKFESLGGAHRLLAETPTDVQRFLDAFFAMKAERFRAMGITDVFAPTEIRAFFRQLFGQSLDTGDFTLAGLEVGGKLRAVTGHSRCGSRLICEFGAIANDELAAQSPGDFLFYENIKAACEAGYLVYDFSVGDEPYKRAWCDIEESQLDVIVPLTTRGRAMSAWFRARSAIKGHIKADPLLWPLAKRIRKLVRGS